MNYNDKGDIKDEQSNEIQNIVMNYLVTEGFKEAAQKFQGECGVEPKIDLSTLGTFVNLIICFLKLLYLYTYYLRQPYTNSRGSSEWKYSRVYSSSKYSAPRALG